MQFQAICSKWNRKLTLSLTASNIDEARDLLHGQGYSIMEIKESDGTQQKWSDKNFFFFDIRVNNVIKTWKIQSDDVFKSYKKLIDDLGYDVVYIYTNEWMSEEQKKVITAKVRDSYRLYKESVWENIDEKKIERTQDEQDIQQISPQILREVEHYTLIWDSTIEKIQNLLLKYHSTIPDDKKLELEKLEHLLLQNKWSSNLWKIKTVVEAALKNIWEIELELVKIGNSEEKKKFLEETNSLLKQIWSSDRIQTDSKESIDIGKSLSKFFSWLTAPSDSQKKNEKKQVDTNSFIYFKNQRELNLYKDSLNKNDIQIIKSIITFQFKNIKKLLLKKKLLLQNIQIIENRINNKNISYTRLVHGFNYYIDSFLFGISELISVWIYTFFLYVISFISINIFTYFDLISFSFKPKTFLFITIFSVTLFIYSFVRNIFVFIFASFIFIYSVVFFSINF
jgi:predicted Zn-dependent protease with MMP-like domain